MLPVVEAPSASVSVEDPDASVGFESTCFVVVDSPVVLSLVVSVGRSVGEPVSFSVVVPEALSSVTSAARNVLATTGIRVVVIAGRVGFLVGVVVSG